MLSCSEYVLKYSLMSNVVDLIFGSCVMPTTAAIVVMGHPPRYPGPKAALAVALSSVACVGDKPIVSTPYVAWGKIPVLYNAVALRLIIASLLALSALALALLSLLVMVLVRLRTATDVSIPKSFEACEVWALIPCFLSNRMRCSLVA